MQLFALLLTTCIAPDSEAAKKYVAWVFGYGSLITSAITNPNSKYVEVTIPYKRGWTAINNYGRATYVGIYPTDEKNTMRGCVTPKTQEELDETDIREQGYKRMELDKDSYKVLVASSTLKIDSQTPLYTYVPVAGDAMEGSMFMSKKTPTVLYPILHSYTLFIYNGLDEWEKRMAAAHSTTLVHGGEFDLFIRQTTHWSKYYLNDVYVARRPWVHEKAATKAQIGVEDKYRFKNMQDAENKYQKKHFTEQSYGPKYYDALYPVEYATMHAEELKTAMTCMIKNQNKGNTFTEARMMCHKDDSKDDNNSIFM